jgi:hypothetical protein
MIEEPPLFGSLALASHRDGSPIKLPRAQDEVVMLAFDQQNSRLVELHIFTGKAAPVTTPGQPPAMRRWVKPLSWQSRRKWASSRLGERKSKPAGGHRPAHKSRIRARYLHRFYEPKTTCEQADVRPEMVDEEQQYRTCELLRLAAGARSHCFMTILDVGVDDGMAYYVTHLNDGEFIQDYVRRRGAVPTVASLALLHQLLQELGKAEEEGQLLSTVSLDQVLVTSQEEEYLQLRLFDYGLSQPRSEAFGQHSSRLVSEACHLLFLLMAGQTYTGGNPEDFGVIAELPANLRFVIKSVLTKPVTHSISRKTLRDEVREAMCSHVSLVQARNPKLLLVADPATLPFSHLQTLLLGNIPLKTMFGASFRIENPELSGCHPFAIPAVNVCAEQQVTLQLLPPERIVHQPTDTAFPPQTWRQDPAKQANLLHMLSLWKGPDWAFLSEAREPGMSLSALMAKRGTLNPGEVTTLLRQIHAGLDQAVETGVQRVDLDPGNIQLCVGYDGPVLPRDLERLHQKRLDAWPKFVVKLRLHKTMRSLCKPRLIDMSPWEYNSTAESVVIADRDECHRTFISLAVYLLTGEGQMREIAEFPTSTPDLAASYLQECLQRVLSGSAVPSPHDFTEQLSHLLTAASTEMDSVEDPLATPHPQASQEMVSAGFVSDFEEDSSPVDVPVAPPLDHSSHTLLLAPVGGNIQPIEFNRPSPPRFSFPWLALAATVLLLGAVAWMIFGGEPAVDMERHAAAPSSSPQKNVVSKVVAEAAPKSADIPPAPALAQPIIHKSPVVEVEAPSLSPSPSPAPVAEVAVTAPQPVSPQPTGPAPITIARAILQENQPVEKLVASSMQNARLVTSNIPTQLPASAVPPAPAPVVAPIAVQPTTPPKEVPPLQEVTIRRAVILTPEEMGHLAQPKTRKRTTRR